MDAFANTGENVRILVGRKTHGRVVWLFGSVDVSGFEGAIVALVFLGRAFVLLVTLFQVDSGVDS